MFRNILVPTDGSKAAKRATDHAINLVSDRGGTVHVLYVVDMGEADFVAVPSDIAETKSRIQRKGEELVEDVRERLDEAAIDCVTAVVTGIPDEEILRYAEENDVDLIAMGSHGKRDPDKPFVGNTARRVITGSSVPVHTV
jgi:nucleotide-binding universal stress UspA family protein